jgi:CubicO group peptidase (beta-lactamase class C family)
MGVLDPIGGWPVGAAAAAVVGADGAVLEAYGDQGAVFPLASVTKPLVALSVLVAVEEGALTLDDPAGPEGSTIRHLLAHASGLAPDKNIAVAKPGTRRIYSNAGFDLLGDQLAAVTGIPCPDYLRQALCEPLGLTGTALVGPPHSGGESSAGDLAIVAAELLHPGRLLHPTTVAALATVQFPGLSGVVPGFGRQPSNDWGLGFEIRDAKSPHWTGAGNAPGTFGHFGRSGTFLWVDPVARLGLVVLTDTEFEQWAKDAWPPLADAVLAAQQNPRNGAGAQNER